MANGPTLPPQAYTREVLAVAFQWLQSQPESIKKLAQSPDALVGLYLRAQRYGNASPENDAPVSSQNFISDLKNLAEGLKQFDDPNRISSILNNPLAGNSLGGNSVGVNAAGAPSTGNNSTVSSASGLSLSATRTSSMNMYSNSHSSNGPSRNSTPSGFMSPAALNQTAAAHSNAPAWTMEAQQPPAGASVDPASLYSLAQTLNAGSGSSSGLSSANRPPLPMQTAMPQTLPPSTLGVSSGVSSGLSMPPAHVDLACYLNPTAQAMIQEVKNHMNLSSDAEVLNMLIAIAYKHVKNLLG